MRTHMELTQAFVQELVDYNPKTGILIWRLRNRPWFNSDASWRRWNNRYAGNLAFTYIAKGYRWGCVFGKNYLAHRVVWLYVHGRWPRSIVFSDGDGANLKLDNLIERIPARPPRVRFATKRQRRVRLPLALAA